MSDQPKSSLAIAIKDAILAYSQEEADQLDGAAVTVALVDVLASLLAGAPTAQTIRGRRELVEEVSGAIADQVKAYQALRPLIIPQPEDIN